MPIKGQQQRVFGPISNRLPKMPHPRLKLLAFFQGLQGYVLSPACYGCPFLNVATEYPDAAYPGHSVALEHKSQSSAGYAVGRGSWCERPEALAKTLILLMDGAYMSARMFGASPSSPAANLAETVHQLLDVSAPHPGRESKRLITRQKVAALMLYSKGCKVTKDPNVFKNR